MGSNAPSWADQWGSADGYGGEGEDMHGSKKSGSSGNKMSKAKAAASARLGEAKAAAAVGAGSAKVAVAAAAHKVKSGTSLGFKWVKDQYQKKNSSK